MPGTPDYQRLTATLPSISQVAFLSQPATDIAAGGSEQITFYSAAGTYSTIRSVSMTAPAIAAATTGNQEIRLYGSDQVNYTLGTSAYSDVLSYGPGYWNTASITQQPPAQAGADQAWFLKAGIVVDATTGCGILCYNNTNAAQTGARFYLLTGTREDLP